MDLQTEKLYLIEWLARLNDMGIIQKIKALQKETGGDMFTRYTAQDMLERAKASEEDIAAGRTISAEDFKNEIDQWIESKRTA
jgi:major membrane immunogen (membrane-anchored lipoprotein)